MVFIVWLVDIYEVLGHVMNFELCFFVHERAFKEYFNIPNSLNQPHYIKLFVQSCASLWIQIMKSLLFLPTEITTYKCLSKKHRNLKAALISHLGSNESMPFYLLRLFIRVCWRYVIILQVPLLLLQRMLVLEEFFILCSCQEKTLCWLHHKTCLRNWEEYETETKSNNAGHTSQSSQKCNHIKHFTFMNNLFWRQPNFTLTNDSLGKFLVGWYGITRY